MSPGWRLEAEKATLAVSVPLVFLSLNSAVGGSLQGVSKFTDEVLRLDLLTSHKCLKLGVVRPVPGAAGRVQDLAQ